jgi:hypothetical protein
MYTERDPVMHFQGSIFGSFPDDDPPCLVETSCIE